MVHSKELQESRAASKAVREGLVQRGYGTSSGKGVGMRWDDTNETQTRNGVNNGNNGNVNSGVSNGGNNGGSNGVNLEPLSEGGYDERYVNTPQQHHSHYNQDRQRHDDGGFHISSAADMRSDSGGLRRREVVDVVDEGQGMLSENRKGLLAKGTWRLTEKRELGSGSFGQVAHCVHSLFICIVFIYILSVSVVRVTFVITMYLLRPPSFIFSYHLSPNQLISLNLLFDSYPHSHSLTSLSNHSI